jgi:hypothetical protein
MSTKDKKSKFCIPIFSDHPWPAPNVMATTVNSQSMRRTSFALYEIDPKSGATVEIFYADIALAQYFGARGADWYWRYRQTNCAPQYAERSILCVLRCVPRRALDISVAPPLTFTLSPSALIIRDAMPLPRSALRFQIFGLVYYLALRASGFATCRWSASRQTLMTLVAHTAPYKILCSARSSSRAAHNL